MFYYKLIGETTSDFSKRVSSFNNGKKICICGKLDPMARGETKVLIGNEVKSMDKHLHSNKTYEFYICMGISTDSDDIMGNIENITYNITFIDREKINMYMETIVPYIKQQKFHHFSAKHITKNNKRKPLWYWYREGDLKENEIPEKPVRVYYTKYLNYKIITSDNYLSLVNRRLNKITEKDKFYIKDIQHSWDKLQQHIPLILYKYKMKVSSGFYIRMIAKNIKQELNIPVHIFDINRVDVEDV